MASDFVRIVVPHDFDRDDYHQWILSGRRVKADGMMRHNPRMYEETATEWICNGDCPAVAWVSDWHARYAIEAEEAGRG